MSKKEKELTPEQKAAKERLSAEVAKAEEKAKAENASRTGQGTRVAVGMTRGRNPQVISYEEFDDALPETLPKSLSEFMTLTKTEDEKLIVEYLIDGFNDAQYTLASDPVAEFVDASWPDDVKKSFRLVVRNYATNANVSIEDAVALIKPGIEKAVAAAKQ